MENFLSKIPQFPGYVFDRVGSPKDGEWFLNFTGELVQSGAISRSDKNYVIYKEDYSKKVHQLPELLPKAELKNYLDVCKHIIVVNVCRTATVWNIWPDFDVTDLDTSYIIGFIPIEFKETTRR